MLKRLIVKNLAIIEDINIEFKTGFNAITGQTGAGKSLLIDSISLLLGKRADADLIRYGALYAEVSGIFQDISVNILDNLSKLGIEVKDELLIYRKITNANKNIIKVNDINITLNDLKKLGLLLGDIHEQQDTYRLINKDNYLSFLDDKSNKYNSLLSDYLMAKMEYDNALNNYYEVLKRNKELNQKLDILEFQKKEIERLELSPDIDIKLEEEINKLSNFDKIYTNINETYELFNGEYFNLDNLYDAKEKLSHIKDYDSKYEELYNLINDAYYSLDSVNSELYNIKEHLDFDPNYLDELNNRLYEIDKIKTKYHMSVFELINYLEQITLDINLATNYDKTIAELDLKLANIFKSTLEKGAKLSQFRKDKALGVEKELVSLSKSLDLDNLVFKIEFNEISFKDHFDKSVFYEDGIDQIDFLVSFNKGEPVKPLIKVASGGELSRLMLAFKILYLNHNDLSFMVFDEIDAGVSGLTARKIGLKLKEIASKTQVFAITHLANVASLANNHLYIEKEIKDNRTKTNIKELCKEERIKEIAYMLSGLEINKEFIDAATKMIENK